MSRARRLPREGHRKRSAELVASLLGLYNVPDFNACFISYRHPQDTNAKKFVQTFVEVLTTQLQMNLPNARIFFDSHGLQVGDTLDKLAQELCRSACLVICYGPRHFDPTHPYCTMEYLAMRRLEEKRLSGMNNYLSENGLIFPVVFRGSHNLPSELRHRVYDTFDDVIEPSHFRRGARLKKIDALARKIYERWERLEQADIFANHDCSGFRFERDQAHGWLRENVQPSRTPMPNR